MPPKVEKTSTKIRRKSFVETIDNKSDVIQYYYSQAVHKPVHHAPVHHGPARPFQYNYGVADSYRYYLLILCAAIIKELLIRSGSQFTEAKTQDEAGVAVGSYSVALPDGRLQTVKYTADPYGGYVAEVSYEGQVGLRRNIYQFLKTLF